MQPKRAKKTTNKGDIKENRSERLFVRIKPSMKKKLVEIAKEQGKSIADLIEDIIKDTE